MNFIRYCDFFDIKFHFYYQNRLKISIFGGLMSIACFIGCIIAALILSIDDIKKLNPKTTKSEIPGGEFRLIDLSESKIWIPWRLITYEEKFIDHRGILYPMISLIEGAYNEKIGMDLKYHDLNYTLCNNTSMANMTDIYKIDTPLNELFCIEQSNIPFGGSWLGDNLYYLEVNLFLCENGINYNQSDKRCTILSDLVDYTNTTWLFEFYYPVVQFQPTNQDIPLVVIFKNHYYRLSSYTYKLERLYIQENILSDDTGLFGTNILNTSCWGLSNTYGDTYFWKEEHDPLVKSNSSCLFSLDIYMDTGYILYTRSFKNIFEIISNIFPVINILIIIFEKITFLIKFAYAKKSLVGSLFESSHSIKGKTKIVFKGINLNESSKKDILQINNSNNKLTNFNDIYKLNHNHNNNNHSAQRSELKGAKSCRISNKSLDKSGITLNSLFSKNIRKNRNSFKLPIKQKSMFPLCYYFLDVFMDKLEKPTKFCCLSKKYLIVYNFVSRIFNISSYILMFKYFNLYKNTLMKELKNFNHENINRKININDNDKMENIEQNIFGTNLDESAIFYNLLVD
jgi:hypothetical protein